MKPMIEYRNTNRLTAALVAGCVLALTALPSAQAGEVDKRMEREIRIAEEFISDMLVESPNWLVSWGGPTSGTYLDGVGVFFQFEASLVSGKHDRKGPFGWSVFRDFGKRVVILGDADEEWEKTSLADDEWVTIIVVLDDHSFFRKNRLERLIVKARAGDLRDSIESMENRGGRDALRGRIVETEY